MDELDRLASDIANVGTSGYKGQRETRASAPRPTFDATLDTAIDTTFGGSRLDMSDGVTDTTGRALDVAIDGPGFFSVSTAQGARYTRNGHFSLDPQRRLITQDGDLVQGTDGKPITVGDGEVRVDQDGTVWAGDAQAGKLSLVTFADPASLVREGSSRLRADGQTPTPVTAPNVHGGALEQSNVSVADRIAELTTVSRGFEALQKSISMVMNDVEGRAIDRLGRA
jgi:flagellar basal body rod protein FlgG